MPFLGGSGGSEKLKEIPMRSISRASRPLVLALAVVSFFLTAGSALAWEWAYGPPNTFDQAFRRVTPVQGCAAQGPGYIAVGTFDQFGPNPEVYVVYTNLAGAPVWEMTYDVQASTYEDEGMAIAEVPGGFVVLSNTRKPGSTPWMPALTFIKCHGGVVWSQVYPDALANRDLRGIDLIQLRTGDPAWGTAPGDLAVAGVWSNGANDDAFLMRTNAGGFPLWNIAYNPGGFEAFNALTEAAPATGQLTGDLVAVGRFNKVNGDLQGLVARVSGNNGAIGAAPQCLAQHGLAVANSQELYNSVTPITNPNFAGQFALIGTTSNPGYVDDVWLTRGTPCNIAAQSRVGNPVAPAPTSERGNDLREILGPVIAPVGGALAIAGDFAPLGAGYDATYLQVATATLFPIGGTGRVFGDHASSAETFFSLAEDPAGFGQTGWVLAGLTESNWEGLGDPRDLYLVHYNPQATPACEKKWSPTAVQLAWPSVALNFQRKAPASYFSVPTLETPQWNPWLICP